MSSYNQCVGRLGEDAAVEFLINQQFLIVHRNFRFRRGEIDIIAIRETTTHFIEVKTRTGFNYGEGELAVNLSKQRTIRLVAEFYLQKFGLTTLNCCFDVIVIDIKQGISQIRFIENAF